MSAACRCLLVTRAIYNAISARIKFKIVQDSKFIVLRRNLPIWQFQAPRTRPILAINIQFNIWQHNEMDVASHPYPILTKWARLKPVSFLSTIKRRKSAKTECSLLSAWGPQDPIWERMTTRPQSCEHDLLDHKLVEMKSLAPSSAHDPQVHRLLVRTSHCFFGRHLQILCGPEPPSQSYLQSFSELEKKQNAL